MLSSHKSVKWAVTAIAVVAAMMLVSAAAQAAIINVPGDQPTIQAGIDAAVNGDEVVVAPGTYCEIIDFSGKAITVRSSDGQEVTIIDAQFQGTVVTCNSGEGPDTVLIGFTITRGLATNGGGMLNLNSSPTVTNCRFFRNETIGGDGDGGGMYNEAIGFFDISPTVTNCTFLENFASQGGGMANVAFFDFAFSSPTVTNCRFLKNGAFRGGGMYNKGSTKFDISSPTVTNCTFSGNTAFDDGGGMFNFVDASPTVTNCTFSSNSADFGGGMYTTDIFAKSTPTVTNCILWGNVPDQLFDMFGTVTFSDVQGGWPGTGNIDADPFFIDDDGPDNIPGTEDDNLRLAAGTPCIDAGNNTAVPKGIITDLDGNDRIRDGDYNGDPVVDMGAYEFVPETISVLNVTQGTLHDSIAQAIQAAVDGDEILANPPAFEAEPVIDFLGKAITLCSIGTLQQGADGQIMMSPGSTLASQADIDQAPGGVIVMADDATLTTRSGQTVTLGGELQVPLASQVDVITDQLLITSPGLLTMGAGSVADIQTNAAVANSGSTSIFGTFFSPAGLHNELTGTLTVSGFIVADVTNDNQATFNGDSYVVGDYLNNGTTDIINGTLFIFGTLINNGTINGNVSGGGGAASGPGDDFGLAVSGDYILGQAASHFMPSDQLSVRIEGHYDVAINDNANYDMAQAELRMIGLGAMPQSLEVMSLDIGPDSAGLDRTLPGHYPIGTLRIGPTRTTVNMADVHDNDGLGQKFCEAIYVENLIIEPGATLNTLGCPVYYVELINNGTVDDPANLIALPPPCPADFDNSGDVGVKDLLILLGAWGPCPKKGDCPADLDFSGDVGVKDLLLLIGVWGMCP